MPTPLLLLLLSALLPLAGTPLLLVAGKRMGQVAGALATLLAAASFGCAMACLMSFLDGGTWNGQNWGAGQLPLQQYVTLVPATVAGVQIHATLYLDSLTAVLACVVSLVGFLVHVYSLTYMRGHPQYHRYFAILAMFLSAMLGLVSSGSLVLLYACWELVGICSYLLIGFYHERPAAPLAATKAFLMNRLADVGFLVAIGVLAASAGTLSLPEIWAKVDQIPPAALWIISAGLLVAAAAKSALFPFHLWLIDAMEGPTPVSALMHAATMVAAGIYLVARVYVLIPTELLLALGILAAVTAVFAAVCALAQDDLKRLLAFSTVSQLALMMLGLSCGLYSAALLHLLTHAFFKALLFLSAGAVIHATGRQRLSHLGGVFRFMPFTGSAFAIGALAIAGAPLLAGFYSKDLLLTQFASLSMTAPASPFSPAIQQTFFYVAVGVSYLTALYIGRAFFRVFISAPTATPAPHDEPHANTAHSRAHESTNLWVVQMALVGLVIIVGFPWLSPPPQVAQTFESSRFEIANSVRPASPDSANRWLDLADVPQSYQPTTEAALPPDGNPEGTAPTPTPAGLAPDPSPDAAPSLLPARAMAKSYSGNAYIYGLALAAVLFGFPPIAQRLPRVQTIRWLASPLRRGLMLNEILILPVVQTTKLLASTLDFLDRYLIDGLVRLISLATVALAAFLARFDTDVVDRLVEGSASSARAVGHALLAGQDGRLRAYVIIAFVTSSLLLATVILLLQ
jgi:NADH-quinone oxidoreductase subunit L